MDYRDLTTKVSYISGCSGRTLATEERAALQSSLLVLKADSKLASVRFWGKICGTNRDYYVAEGFGESKLSTKRIFCSVDGVDWVLLPDISDEIKMICKRITGRFTGNASFEYQLPMDPLPVPPKEKQKEAKKEATADVAPDVAAPTDAAAPAPAPVTDAPPAPADPAAPAAPPADAAPVIPSVAVEAPKEEEEASGEEESEGEAEEGKDAESKSAPKIRKIIISEEKRLAATVLAIDEETSIVPRGAVILTSDHRVLVNPSFEGMKLSLFVAQFEGLNMPGAMSLRSYLHLREPRNLAKKSLLEKEGLSKSFDFLDTADEDVPKGSWVLQYDSVQQMTMIRSLLWPGFYFYHVTGTSSHGHCYIGTGERNSNIGFMVR